MHEAFSRRKRCRIAKQLATSRVPNQTTQPATLHAKLCSISDQKCPAAACEDIAPNMPSMPCGERVSHGSCEDACLATRRLTCDTERGQRGQVAHRRGRSPSFLRPWRRASAETAPAQNGGAQHSSRAQRIRMGPSFGTAADRPAVPVVQAECMAFDPEAAREPSRAVCSFSRKSKPLITV